MGDGFRGATAQQRADVRWQFRDKPWDCDFCRRAFKTERWLGQHTRTCSHNPQARMYTSGEYDPILSDDGRIARGYVWNGRNERERQRIREGMTDALGALGVPVRPIGPSHRDVILGPDPEEPCARCPESFHRHSEAGCSLCSCPAFTYATKEAR